MEDGSKKKRKERFRSVSPDHTEAEAFFVGILNSLDEHVAVVEKDGRIIAVNDAWREFARQNDAKSPSAVSEGVNYIEVCRNVTGEDSDFAKRAIEGMRKVIEGEAEIFTLEYPCSSPNEDRWFLMTAVQMQRPEGGAVVTHTNITGRKEVEDRLRRSEQHLLESREEYRALARKLLTAREDASRRLARELHDSVSQRMALISMLAAKMEIDCSDSEKNRQGLRRIQEEMTQLLGDLHDIARQLHPQIIEDLGLPDAVASFCTSFSKYEGIPIEFVPGELPAEMPRVTALNLYRIIQESLSNTAKHAKATGVHIDLGTRGGSLHLSIKDDGVGFDPDAIRGKKRLGLVSLRERASIIGGNIDISSAPGSGTTVSVEVPLNAD